MIDKIKKYDVHFAFYMLKFHKHKILNKIMMFISSCGDFGMSWLIIVLITNLFKKTRSMSIHLLLALIVATLIGQITIKTIVKRKRPCHTYTNVQMLVSVPNDLSFPSGHTTSSFACCTVLFLYSPALGIIGLIYATLTAISRLYLFVHYLSDVLFGAMLGIIIGYIVCII